jgi:hypothetical protein
MLRAYSGSKNALVSPELQRITPFAQRAVADIFQRLDGCVLRGLRRLAVRSACIAE